MQSSASLHLSKLMYSLDLEQKQGSKVEQKVLKKEFKNLLELKFLQVLSEISKPWD